MLVIGASDILRVLYDNPKTTLNNWYNLEYNV